MPAPLANIITLGAIDLPRLREFYRSLGWPQIVDGEDFAAFELQGAVVALFPRDRLASDGRTEASADTGLRFTVGIVTSRREEVEEVVDRMRAAGGTVTKAPEDAEFFDGRSAYVSDPEGNFWEVAWVAADNPLVAGARRAAGVGPSGHQP
jgi:predicted lactoylglutathione lyase